MSSQIDKRFLAQLISGPAPVIDLLSFSSADWALLLHTADREGVSPLLYWKLSKSAEFASLPQDVGDVLRLAYARTWAHNQTIIKELGAIAQVFHASEIPVVVLKGACFALTIYPDVGLRPMRDLDTLVPASKLSAAVQLASSLGYMNILPEASRGLRELLNHEVCLHKSGEPSLPLEIHTSLIADKVFTYAVPVDWFWQQTKVFEGRWEQKFNNLLMLNPTAQLLYAASHAMLQHGGHNSPLRWYYDLDRLIRVDGSNIDWEQLLSQAREFEWGSALRAALSQTKEYFCTPIPVTVQNNLFRHVDRFEPLVIKKQSKPATLVLEEEQNLSSLNWYGKTRLVLALAFPSPAYMCWRYQLKSLWALPVFYPFRWWGIIKDLIRTAFALLKVWQAKVTRT